jgi:hypothetical protein
MGPKSQKKDNKIYKTYKGSSRVSRGESSPVKPFLKFRTAEKGLYKAFRVSY